MAYIDIDIYVTMQMAREPSVIMPFQGGFVTISRHCCSRLGMTSSLWMPSIGGDFGFFELSDAMNPPWGVSPHNNDRQKDPLT